MKIIQNYIAEMKKEVQKKEIQKILKSLGIESFQKNMFGEKEESFTFNTDLSVNIHQDLMLAQKNLTQIPIQLGIAIGHVSFKNNQLHDLKNIAKHINGTLHLTGNPINDLTYLPNKVMQSIHIDKIEENEFKKFNQMEYFQELNIYCTNNDIPEYLKSFKSTIKEEKNNIQFNITFDEFKIYIEKSDLESIIKEDTKISKIKNKL